MVWQKNLMSEKRGDGQPFDCPPRYSISSVRVPYPYALKQQQVDV